ncbi:MAG: hypothetical protein EPN17_09900 [Methylobacter sp.]|nr:MAG: hypothetical protein EPN17_09900 [Methylobacter sp.]
MKKLVCILALAVVSNGVCAESAPAAATTAVEAQKDGVRTGVRTPTGDVNKFWDAIDWDDLSAEEQKLWSVLSDGASWNKLSNEERAAATALGFNKKSWNSVPASK